MLVLSRKPGESIQVGEGIKVQVLRVQGNRVWIGVEADPDVQILRGELYAVRELIRAEEKARDQEPQPDVITFQ
jgi:carbon storage regulator